MAEALKIGSLSSSSNNAVTLKDKLTRASDTYYKALDSKDLEQIDKARRELNALQEEQAESVSTGSFEKFQAMVGGSADPGQAIY